MAAIVPRILKLKVAASGLHPQISPLQRRCHGGEWCALTGRWSRRAFGHPHRLHSHERWDREVDVLIGRVVAVVPSIRPIIIIIH